MTPLRWYKNLVRKMELSYHSLYSKQRNRKMKTWHVEISDPEPGEDIEDVAS